MGPLMTLPPLRLVAEAWADHGGPLRLGLLAGALTLAAGVLVVIIVMRLARKPSSSPE